MKSSIDMPQRPSGNDSSVTSSEMFDLALPVVREGEEPLPTADPTYAAQMRHARFLLRSQPPDFYARRLEAMNPERFTIP